MKAIELRKLFADENEICISDCKFIPEAYPNGYAKWLEKKIQNADEVGRENNEQYAYEQAMKYEAWLCDNGYTKTISARPDYCDFKEQEEQP